MNLSDKFINSSLADVQQQNQMPLRMEMILGNNHEFPAMPTNNTLIMLTNDLYCV
jgi:hypothetical protein